MEIELNPLVAMYHERLQPIVIDCLNDVNLTKKWLDFASFVDRWNILSNVEFIEANNNIPKNHAKSTDNTINAFA